jgi:glycerophosphoryl diester phosphodiesterase
LPARLLSFNQVPDGICITVLLYYKVMKIIGHRGAAGLAPENSLRSFRLALDLGVDGVEFDIQVTRDGQPVVCHDNLLSRLSSSTESISQLSYAQLKKISLHSGERIPLLSEVLGLLGSLPAIAEIKVTGQTEAICKVFDDFPKATITVASFQASVIADIHRLRPHLPRLLAENHDPFRGMRVARRYGAGLDLNRGLLNPITYRQTRRAGVPLMVYTVDQPLVAWFIRLLYPNVWLCTNHPERFLPSRTLSAAPKK